MMQRDADGDSNDRFLERLLRTVIVASGEVIEIETNLIAINRNVLSRRKVSGSSPARVALMCRVRMHEPQKNTEKKPFFPRNLAGIVEQF